MHDLLTPHFYLRSGAGDRSHCGHSDSSSGAADRRVPGGVRQGHGSVVLRR